MLASPRFRTAVAGVSAALVLAACSEKVVESAPPTVPVPRPVASPPTAVDPAGEVSRADVRPRAALVDAATSALVILSADPPALRVLPPAGEAREIALPSGGGGLAGDGAGRVYTATRGGVLVADVATGAVTRNAVDGQSETEFTAVARRADGRLVLGSAEGTVYTLSEDGGSVARTADGFAGVDAIVTVGDTAVVLDAAQTSVSALTERGTVAQALRAGLGATAITADPAGRVLATDTRGGQLLVFTVDPLILRQAYPVGDSPFGVAGSATLVWVSQTATNSVVGYDLSTGIPVEKVRYPTVRQPDWLAYDRPSDTLYVVSGAGAGVQVIAGAGGGR